MDAMLAFLLLFYWRYFDARRAIMLRKRRRLFEAQRLIEVARQQLGQQRILVIASVVININFTLCG